jgi:hypothetical protein
MNVRLGLPPRKLMNLPFLHLRGRDIDAIGLTATTHGKVHIKRGQTLTNITLGDDVKSSRVIENMVVERKLATEINGQTRGMGKDR